MIKKSNVNKVDEFIKDRVLIFLKKNKDYGDSVLKSLLKFGDSSVYVRIEDKVNRYLQLTYTTEQAEVNDEKVYDTILDLFNYAMMFNAYKVDGARILLTDLVECMFKEANNIAYGEFKSSFIYELLRVNLELSEKDTISILESIKIQIDNSYLQS